MQQDLFIRRAFELACRGSGRVAPNPLVGAVLVQEGRIIGEGWHQQYGEAHAEANCLNSVCASDRQFIPESTMYVTLEPCAHYGKQPPCAVLLVQEQVKKVVIATNDTFEQVNGKGIQILQEGRVETAVLQNQQTGRWLNRRFFTAQEKKRPYVILKWAESRDGFIAPLSRQRTQLSHPFTKTLTHRWRSAESAILVGYQTALHDDPALDARHWDQQHPLRIVIDRKLQLPATHQLLDGSMPTWFLNEQTEKATGLTQYLKLNFDDFFTALFERLLAAGKTSLFVEGGAFTLQQFLDKGWWDEARVYQTAAALGGGIAAPVIAVPGEAAYSCGIGTDTWNIITNPASGFTLVNDFLF